MQPSAMPFDSGMTFEPSEPARQPKRRRVDYLDPITLQGQPIPDREWMIENFIPRRSVTILGGDGGLGKSLLAQQMLTAAALGRNWLGIPTAPCKTLALFCEDPIDELHRRQDAINRHYQADFADLENVRWLPRLGEANVLMGPDGNLNPLFNAVLEEAQSFGAELVLLDSLHDLFAGNENVRAEARRFMHALQRIANATNGAVILLAHPSVQGLTTGSGTSGNTAWNNACRSRLYLKVSPDDDPDERVLQRKKLNYGARGGDIRLKWEDGVFITAEPPESGVFAGMKGRNAERAFMDALAAITERGQRVNTAKNTGNYAPRSMLGMSQTKGFTERDLARAMHALFDLRKIEVREDGFASRKRTFIAIKEEGNP